MGHSNKPLVIETMGPSCYDGQDFTCELGSRFLLVIEDPRDTCYLFGRLSVVVCSQRFNVACVAKSFGDVCDDSANQPKHKYNGSPIFFALGIYIDTKGDKKVTLMSLHCWMAVSCRSSLVWVHL
jgi:hypothetical protein